MALKERDEELRESASSASGIVIRLEDILMGESLSKMLKVSDEITDYYTDVFKDKISNLKAEMKKLPNPMEDPDYLEYLEIMELLKSTSYINSSKIEKLVKVYNDSIEYNFGPSAHNKHELFVEEPYSFEDALADGDILNRIMLRLPEVMILPARVKIDREIAEIRSYLYQLKGINAEKVFFAVNKEIFFSRYREIASILKSAKSTGKNIELVIDAGDAFIEKPNTPKSEVPYSYTKAQMNKINELIEKNIVDEMYFSEFYEESFMPTDRRELWSFDDVYEANSDKEIVADYIKEAGLTPFEAIIEVNREVTKSKYVGSATYNEKTRTFLTASAARSFTENEMKNKAFVCTGYASFAKAIMDAIASPNIKTTLVPVDLYNKKTLRRKYSSTHLILLVEITDEKYGIKNGKYIWDPTWSIETLDFVLCPVSDLKHFRSLYADIDHKNKTKVSKFLFSPRSFALPEEQVKNTIYDEYHNGGEAISLDTYRRALEETFDKLRKLKYCPDRTVLYKSNKELINKIFTDTIHRLSMLSPETSSNTFYRQMRDFYLEHEDIYPNWKEKWRAYNETRKLR